MDEELVISSAEDYYGATQWKLKVSSGTVFLLQLMNAESVGYLLSILPEEGIEGRTGLFQFVQKYLEGVTKYLILPNIVKPRIPAEKLYIMDVVDIMESLMDRLGMSEITVTEDDDGFLESEPRVDP